MPTGPSISFVVPVRNDADNLRACLASIRADNPNPERFEIVVADNGSTDNSADVARDAGARVLTLPDLTVAALRNRAAQAGRAPVLAFVDADHRIDLHWTQSALESLMVPGTAAVGAPYRAPADGTWVQRAYDTFRDHGDRLTEVEWLGSGNMAVDRVAFLAVGGFDTSLVTCEDVDLCQRLRARGGRIVADPRMRSTHLGDPATLGALFFGELWRGRDNLRASLRSLTLRGVPSLAIPLVNLGLLIAAVLALAVAGVGGLPVAAAAGLGIAAFAALRASVMVSRLRPRSLAGSVQALAVAATYDLARALAPVWPTAHAARRRAEAR